MRKGGGGSLGKDRKGRERGERGPLERYEEAMLKPKVGGAEGQAGKITGR